MLRITQPIRNMTAEAGASAVGASRAQVNSNGLLISGPVTAQQLLLKTPQPAPPSQLYTTFASAVPLSWVEGCTELLFSRFSALKSAAVTRNERVLLFEWADGARLPPESLQELAYVGVVDAVLLGDKIVWVGTSKEFIEMLNDLGSEDGLAHRLGQWETQTAVDFLARFGGPQIDLLKSILYELWTQYWRNSRGGLPLAKVLLHFFGPDPGFVCQLIYRVHDQKGDQFMELKALFEQFTHNMDPNEATTLFPMMLVHLRETFYKKEDVHGVLKFLIGVSRNLPGSPSLSQNRLRIEVLGTINAMLFSGSTSQNRQDVIQWIEALPRRTANGLLDDNCMILELVPSLFALLAGSDLDVAMFACELVRYLWNEFAEINEKGKQEIANNLACGFIPPLISLIANKNVLQLEYERRRTLEYLSELLVRSNFDRVQQYVEMVDNFLLSRHGFQANHSFRFWWCSSPPFLSTIAYNRGEIVVSNSFISVLQKWFFMWEYHGGAHECILKVVAKGDDRQAILTQWQEVNMTQYNNTNGYCARRDLLHRFLFP